MGLPVGLGGVFGGTGVGVLMGLPFCVIGWDSC